MKTKLLLIIPLIGLLSCSKNNDPPEDKTLEKVNLTISELAISNENNNFSFDLFRKITLNQPENKNVFISPLCIYYALGMTAEGANNRTLEEFKKLLGWDKLDDKTILENIKSLYEKLMPRDNTIQFTIANSLWPRIDFSLKQDYTNNLSTYYNAKLTPLDFTDEKSKDVINKWIEDNTNGKIKDMLDKISADAVLYLVNAIYFKADWKYQFEEEDTRKATFTGFNQLTAQVDMMNMNTVVSYLETSTFKSISLPYSDSLFRMVIFLPNNPDNFSAFLEQLTNENWNDWQKQYIYTELNIGLPKFKFEFGTYELNEELKSMGLHDAFSEAADFTRMTDQMVCISRVLHKAFIDVNEKGSEAAAATIVEMKETSAGNTFYANSPFVFFIVNTAGNTILFSGKVSMPVLE